MIHYMIYLDFKNILIINYCSKLSIELVRFKCVNELKNAKIIFN